MLAFLGIGAQKAGTTWLFEQLRRHPQLTFPLGKEAHFWNHDPDDASVFSYLERFGGDGICGGEITPAYAIMPEENIRRIYARVPGLRLIYLIRNPVDRAWSSALMALERSELTIEEASDQWFIDHFRSTGSRRRGDYAACLRTWRKVYPPEQLLVLRFEQLQEAPEQLLNRCFDHLDVKIQPPAVLRENGCRERSFAGRGFVLRPSLVPVLLELYQDPIRQLSELLEVDLDLWLAAPSADTPFVPRESDGRAF